MHAGLARVPYYYYGTAGTTTTTGTTAAATTTTTTTNTTIGTVYVYRYWCVQSEYVPYYSVFIVQCTHCTVYIRVNDSLLSECYSTIITMKMNRTGTRILLHVPVDLDLDLLLLSYYRSMNYK